MSVAAKFIVPIRNELIRILNIHIFISNVQFLETGSTKTLTWNSGLTSLTQCTALVFCVAQFALSLSKDINHTNLDFQKSGYGNFTSLRPKSTFSQSDWDKISIHSSFLFAYLSQITVTCSKKRNSVTVDDFSCYSCDSVTTFLFDGLRWNRHATVYRMIEIRFQ